MTEYRKDIQKELAEIAVFWTEIGDHRVAIPEKEALRFLIVMTRPTNLQDTLETCMRINEN